MITVLNGITQARMVSFVDLVMLHDCYSIVEEFILLDSMVRVKIA
jgi:hypothetical protein